MVALDWPRDRSTAVPHSTPPLVLSHFHQPSHTRFTLMAIHTTISSFSGYVQETRVHNHRWMLCCLLAFRQKQPRYASIVLQTAYDVSACGPSRAVQSDICRLSTTQSMASWKPSPPAREAKRLLALANTNSDDLCRLQWEPFP